MDYDLCHGFSDNGRKRENRSRQLGVLPLLQLGREVYLQSMCIIFVWLSTDTTGLEDWSVLDGLGRLVIEPTIAHLCMACLG